MELVVQSTLILQFSLPKVLIYKCSSWSKFQKTVLSNVERSRLFFLSIRFFQKLFLKNRMSKFLQNFTNTYMVLLWAEIVLFTSVH